MDIDRVRYFHVFAETGSLVKASAILFISQPALSKALKLLESEVGIALLEPEGRGLRLTEAGKHFQNTTAPLLKNWLEIPKSLQDFKTWTPTRLGSCEIFTTYFLSRLNEFTTLDSLEVHEYGPGHLEEAIAEARVDIGITYAPIPKSGIEFSEITKIRMGVFGLVDHFKEQEFPSLPFVVPLSTTKGAPSRIMGHDGWPDHLYDRNIKFRVSMMESAMQLCRKGLCVAYLPDFVVQLHNEDVLAKRKLVEFKSPLLKKNQLQSVFIIQRKNASKSTLYRQIEKSLRSLS
jgi:DNA-binding transcriptional LysR family regulator